jgi:hypothetical protein
MSVSSATIVQHNSSSFTKKQCYFNSNQSAGPGEAGDVVVAIKINVPTAPTPIPLCVKSASKLVIMQTNVPIGSTIPTQLNLILLLLFSQLNRCNLILIGTIILVLPTISPMSCPI